MSLDYYFCAEGLTEATCVERLIAEARLEPMTGEGLRSGRRLSGPGLAVWVNGDLEEPRGSWARHVLRPEVEILLTQAKFLHPAPIHRAIAEVLGTALRAASGDAIFYFTQGSRLDLQRRAGVLRVDDDPEGFWHCYPGTLAALGLACSFARLPSM